MIQSIRFFFRFITPFLWIGVYILKTYFFPHLAFLETAHVILLASMVGYFTNFIAIRMLFHPRKKTAFARQGMIPANQDRIARELGQGISVQFFNTEDILKYISEKNLLEDALEKLRTYLCEKVEDEKFQDSVISFIRTRFELYSDQIYFFLLKFMERIVLSDIQNLNHLKMILRESALLLEKNLTPENISRITDFLTAAIKKNLPQLSRFINEQLQDFIEEQSFIKKQIFRIGTWISNLSYEEIYNYLHKLLSSVETRQKIYDMILKKSSSLNEYLQSDKGRNLLKRFLESVLPHLHKAMKERGLPYLLEQFRQKLHSGSSLKKLRAYLASLTAFFHRELISLMKRGKIHQFLTRALPVLLDKIRVSELVTEKVKSLNTDELEAMLLDASGQHLREIEILGGLLGGFTGIAIFNVKLFGILAGIGIIMGIVEKILTRFLRKKGFRIDLNRKKEFIEPAALLLISLIRQSNSEEGEKTVSVSPSMRDRIIKQLKLKRENGEIFKEFFLQEQRSHPHFQTIYQELSRKLLPGQTEWLIMKFRETLRSPSL